VDETQFMSIGEVKGEPGDGGPPPSVRTKYALKPSWAPIGPAAEFVFVTTDPLNGAIYFIPLPLMPPALPTTR
jgi:hypothetical protein